MCTGDMESDTEKNLNPTKSREAMEINMNHDDLSDVSDLEDSIGCLSEDDVQTKKNDNETEKTEDVKQEVDIKMVIMLQLIEVTVVPENSVFGETFSK